jgi:hypothetical protein
MQSHCSRAFGLDYRGRGISFGIPSTESFDLSFARCLFFGWVFTVHCTEILWSGVTYRTSCLSDALHEAGQLPGGFWRDYRNFSTSGGQVSSLAVSDS